MKTTSDAQTEPAEPRSVQRMVRRQAFEKWIGEHPYEQDTSRWPQDDKYAWPGQYKVYQVQLAWDAWCESANSMLNRTGGFTDKGKHE